MKRLTAGWLVFAASLASLAGGCGVRRPLEDDGGAGAGGTLAVADAGASAGQAGAAPAKVSCPAGVTALQPRVLVHGQFTSLAVIDGAVLATGIFALTRLSLLDEPTVILSQMSEVRGVVVIGQNAYFTAGSASRPDGITTSLFAVPVAGGSPALIAEVPFSVLDPSTDGAALYFATALGITRVAVTDGAQTTLALPNALGVNGIAVHEGFVYVAAYGGSSALPGVIVKLPTSGGAPQTIVANLGHSWSLVADASGLFWSEDPPVGTFGEGRVARAELDGSGVRTLVPRGARSLVVDGGYLYFALDSIGKVPVGGGEVTTLVPGLIGPGLLTVANGNAVWVDPASQAKSDPTLPALMTTCW